MRKVIETIRKSNTAKNTDERVIIDNNNNKHLEFFMNGSWMLIVRSLSHSF